MPHCVLCSRRGFVTLEVVSIGDFRRRRFDSVDEYDRRFSVCDTPVAGGAPLVRSPQLPVAKEYCKPLVMMPVYPSRPRATPTFAPMAMLMKLPFLLFTTLVMY